MYRLNIFTAYHSPAPLTQIKSKAVVSYINKGAFLCRRKFFAVYFYDLDTYSQIFYKKVFKNCQLQKVLL